MKRMFLTVSVLAFLVSISANLMAGGIEIAKRYSAPIEKPATTKATPQAGIASAKEAGQAMAGLEVKELSGATGQTANLQSEVKELGGYIWTGA